MLSRSGFELNEIWHRQIDLVEADLKGQTLRRDVDVNPADEDARGQLVAHLRRTGQHDEADHHELSPHVHAYQEAHSTVTRLTRADFHRNLTREERNERGKAMTARETHYGNALSVAIKHVKRRTGEEAPKHEDVGEHLAKHLDPKKAVDNGDLTSQVLDLHHHDWGGKRGGSYGRNQTYGEFKRDVDVHEYGHAHEFAGPDGEPVERSRWAHERHNSEDEKDHAKHPGIEAIKRSLSHTGAGSVTSHHVNVAPGRFRHERAFHQFEVTPAKQGEKVKHTEPNVTQANYEGDV